MQCPDCGYLLTSFEQACPRCEHLKQKSPQVFQASSAPLPANRSNNQTYIIIGLAILLATMSGICIGMYIMLGNSRQLPETKFSAPSQANNTPPLSAPRLQNNSIRQSQPVIMPSRQPQMEIANNELDKIVGDYNACLRRMDDTAQKRARNSAEFTNRPSDYLNQEDQRLFDEFIIAASQALELRQKLNIYPQFTSNYRETTNLNTDARRTFDAPNAMRLRETSMLKYVEKR